MSWSGVAARSPQVTYPSRAGRPRSPHPVEVYSTGGDDPSWPVVPSEGFTLVGNRRGEPTTEVVWTKSESDVQPFASPGGWVFTHNGTIANDLALYEQLLAPGETPPTRIDS